MVTATFAVVEVLLATTRSGPAYSAPSKLASTPTPEPSQSHKDTRTQSPTGCLSNKSARKRAVWCSRASHTEELGSSSRQQASACPPLLLERTA